MVNESVPRREFLRAGLLGLSLADCLRTVAAGEPSSPESKRRAILVFLGGGPSHHETFDPKPDAPAEVRGEFGALATRLAGVHFSSALPRLTEQAQHLAILRAVTHRDGAHEPGVAYMTTGYSFRPGHNFPAVGAVVGHERQESIRVTGLPPYVALPDGRGGGHLGPAYNPFSIPGDPNDPGFRVQDIAPGEGLSSDRMQRRRQVSAQLGEDFQRSRSTEVQAAADRFTAQAYDLITSSRAQAAFDLAREDGRMRERYGRSPFGQRLLLARRLVEAGVPFITVTESDWDDHQGIFPKLKQRLPAFDQGFAALVADLDDRGLLADTLVVVLGEFGRTPRINAMQGRDHWPNAFSVVLAGAGVRGQVIGASDKEGAYPKDRPVTPEELFHSLYVLLGIDPTRFLLATSGREIQIVRDGKFISELRS